MIPTVSWGSFPLENSDKKHKWNLYDCDKIVGGKEKDQCAGFNHFCHFQIDCKFPNIIVDVIKYAQNISFSSFS